MDRTDRGQPGMPMDGAEQALEAHLAACVSEALRLLREARAEERRRVAMDLHDGVAAELVGTAMVLAAAEHGTAPPAVRAMLHDAWRTVQGAAVAVREYAAALDATEPPPAGLVEGLTSLVDLLRGAGAEATLRIAPGSPERLPPGSSAQVLAVVREAASNALRHGRARAVDVDLRIRGRSAVVEVRDDGVGFDPAGARLGMGLANMRRRAAALGGRLTVRSVPGAGARVRLAIPILPEED